MLIHTAPKTDLRAQLSELKTGYVGEPLTKQVVDQYWTPRHFSIDDADQFCFAPVSTLDAAENMFLERELIHLVPSMLMHDYGVLNARSIFPVYFANDPGAESVIIPLTNETGEAEIVTDYAKDAPLAETEVGEQETRVRPILAAAQWTAQEIRAAAKARREGRRNVQLDQAKTGAARRAMLRKENKIAFSGDTAYGLHGFFTDTDIPRETAAQTFATGTVDQNLTELNDLANKVPSSTEDIEMPDIMGLAPANFDFLATQRVGTDSTMTTLRFFQANSPHIRTVVRVREFKGAGPAGVDVAAAWPRDLSKMRLVVGMDLMQHPPERRGRVVRVEYEARVGGLVIHRPKACRILENT